MTNTFASGFLIAVIFMAGFMSFVLAHEATHLLQASEPEGICLGRCYYNSPNINPSTGFAFATAHGLEAYDNLDESWPNIVGSLVMGFVIAFGFVCLFVISGNDDCFFPSHENDLRREETKEAKKK